MKKVILTIDTEGHDGLDPVKNLIWGKTDEGLFGIDRIMDICDTHNINALFFVDFAEAWDYGEDKITEVVTHILGRGHDVGVHIHPDHMADKNRLFLWEYTKNEQFDIIKRCTDLYSKITGEQPLAFRAGKYGANRDTLDIVSELGYQYEFSQFYGQKWCGIKPPITINTPCKYKGITEIPVTVYESISIGSFKRIDKIDATMNFHEYIYVMSKMKKLTDNLVIVLFYHSFSMLNWRENPDNISFDESEEKKFISAIEYITNSDHYEFVNYKDLNLQEGEINISVPQNNYIFSNKNPFSSFWFTFLRANDIKKYNKKADLLVKSMIYGCLAIVTVIILIIII